MDTVRASFTPDDWQLIEDALSYYRMSAEGGGPDDHPLPDIRRVARRLSRIMARIEAAVAAA